MPLNSFQFLSSFSHGRFPVPGCGACTLMFPGQAFGHFLLLSLFSVLFFLALLECLWASTRHAYFLSEMKRPPPALVRDRGSGQPIKFDVGAITSVIVAVPHLRPN